MKEYVVIRFAIGRSGIAETITPFRYRLSVLAIDEYTCNTNNEYVLFFVCMCFFYYYFYFEYKT